MLPTLLTCRRGLQSKTRWVVPPHGTVSLLVQFSSSEVGRFSEMLDFAVLCGERHHRVTLLAACDYPHINTDPWCVLPLHTAQDNV